MAVGPRERSRIKFDCDNGVVLTEKSLDQRATDTATTTCHDIRTVHDRTPIEKSALTEALWSAYSGRLIGSVARLLHSVKDDHQRLESRLTCCASAAAEALQKLPKCPRSQAPKAVSCKRLLDGSGRVNG